MEETQKYLFVSLLYGVVKVVEFWGHPVED
jgi:hypothetical protein